MKKIFVKVFALAAVMIVAAACLSACVDYNTTTPEKTVLEGSGEIASSSYALENTPYKLIIDNVFTESGKLTLAATDSADTVKVSVEQNIFDTVSVAANDGVVTVSGNSDYLYKTDHFKIDIDASVTEIIINGSLEVSAEIGAVADFDMEINGACKGNVSAVCENKFDLTANGAGAFTITGSCRTGKIVLNGASKFDSIGFAAVDLTAEINGAGQMDVFASGTLNATVNGIGRITYQGNPTVSKRVNGLGTITASDED